LFQAYLEVKEKDATMERHPNAAEMAGRKRAIRRGDKSDEMTTIGR